MFLGVRRVASLTFISLLGTAALSCASRDATQAAASSVAPIEVVDDGGFTVKLAKPAARVISLIPSATETLISLGAAGNIVARTRYDTDSAVASLPSVGGGVDPSVEAIVALHPDLVITWESDKRQLVRQRLVDFGIAVYILRTQDTSDVFREISVIGKLVGRDSAAHAIASSVRATLDSLKASVAHAVAPSVFYVVYNDPPMTAGPGTFIGQLLSLAGGKSIFSETSQLWPNVAMEEIVKRDPDVLVVPVGEFKNNSLARFQAMAGWRDLRAVRTKRVYEVDADLLSRPSPSIARAARVLRDVLHPEMASK